MPTSESGTATLGMIVAATLRRNRKITMTTSATVSISENCTSRTDARMVTVRSVRMVTFMEAGRLARSCGSSVFTRSTTWMMLAPGCRWMLRITAGVRFIHAASLLFSTLSMTLATSERATGEPLRYATTTDW